MAGTLHLSSIHLLIGVSITSWLQCLSAELVIQNEVIEKQI